MVVPTPPTSKHARLHIRRRTTLFDRLGWTCARCGQGSLKPSSLHVDHVQGDRNGVNTKVELQRLLALPLVALWHQAQTLCPPCHVSKSLEAGDYGPLFTAKAAA